MARRRLCRPRGSGSAKVTDIGRWDYVLLEQMLLHDPRGVLDVFPACGLHFLCELECWERLRKEHPKETGRLINLALPRGIREKPEAQDA